MTNHKPEREVTDDLDAMLREADAKAKRDINASIALSRGTGKPFSARRTPLDEMMNLALSPSIRGGRGAKQIGLANASLFGTIALRARANREYAKFADVGKPKNPKKVARNKRAKESRRRNRR